MSLEKTHYDLTTEQRTAKWPAREHVGRAGDIWFDPSSNAFRVYTGSRGGKIIGGASSFTTLPDFLSYVSGTTLEVGQGSQGLWFSGDAGNQTPSYPVRTNFSISGQDGVVVELDMVVNAGCSDFGLCIFERGANPLWDWNANPSRIAASYNCGDPWIYGTTSSQISQVWEIPDNGLYKVRFTYDPQAPTDNVTLQTLDDAGTLLDTITLTQTLDQSKGYYIGFAADQDTTAFRTYIKNLSINVGEGDPDYTDSLLISTPAALINGQQILSLDANGILNFPNNNGQIGQLESPYTGLEFRTGSDADWIGISYGEINDNNTSYFYFDKDGSNYLTDNHRAHLQIKNPAHDGHVEWLFESNGTLTLPAGGNITSPDYNFSFNKDTGGDGVPTLGTVVTDAGGMGGTLVGEIFMGSGYGEFRSIYNSDNIGSTSSGLVYAGVEGFNYAQYGDVNFAGMVSQTPHIDSMYTISLSTNTGQIVIGFTQNGQTSVSEDWSTTVGTLTTDYTVNGLFANTTKTVISGGTSTYSTVKLTDSVTITANSTGTDNSWAFETPGIFNLPNLGFVPQAGNGSVGGFARNDDILYFKTSTGWKVIQFAA